MAKLLDVAQMRCRLEGLSHANLVEVALAAVANDTRKLDEAMAALRLTSAPAAFKPLAKTRSSAADGKPDAIVVVDPLSTGARLAAEAQARGFLIVRVMSQAFPDELLSIIPAACGSLNWKATVMYDACLLYTSPSPRDQRGSRMPSSA